MPFTTPLIEVPSAPNETTRATNPDNTLGREYVGLLRNILRFLTPVKAALGQLEYLESVTVTNLPAAASNTGARYLVTDSNTATFNATVGSGGANIVPVFSNGTNWKVG